MSSIVYDSVSVLLYANHVKKGPLTVEDAKALLGWEEGEFEKGEYRFKDVNGKKIQLHNNDTNRPFRMGLCKRYVSELLRNTWTLNGETIVIDRKGKIQDGQHRLVALVLAEQQRLKAVEKWEVYGHRGPIKMEVIVVTGIADKTETVDTLNLGQKRSLGDIVFRNGEFGSDNLREQTRLSNTLAQAARLVWLRQGGGTVSDAPHFPPSEALSFIKDHTRLKDAVSLIFTEEGGPEKLISPFVPLGTAAGLLYLMATAGTDYEKYQEKGMEALKFGQWNKTKEFWQLFASKAGLEKTSPILVLQNRLVNMDSGSGASRDEKIGMIIKAYQLWLDGKPADAKAIKIPKVKTETGKMVLSEIPRLGGIDTEVFPADEEEVEGEEDGEATEEATEETKAPAKKPSAKKTPAKDKDSGTKAPAKKADFKVGQKVTVKQKDCEFEGTVTEVYPEGKMLSVKATKMLRQDDEDPVVIGTEYGATFKEAL